MSVALITGSAGLIGAETTRLFAARGFDVVGIDNDMRQSFFGAEASTLSSRHALETSLKGYRHVDADIRDKRAIEEVFSRHGRAIAVVVHAAAQPSHDWAARDPETDFSVNAGGTLTLLELTRRHCPEAPFVFLSTNKVYGDRPNRLPLIEKETRWEVEPTHPFAAHGIDETMSIDETLHSLFGVSKAAADLMVQEYGRYFGLKTICLRGGCLTGGGHAGTELHGFLSYLVKCTVLGKSYTVYGHKGKQVRDNIHARDLANAIWQIFRKPGVGAVYNIGGSRHSNCSMLEAIGRCEALTGRRLDWTYRDEARAGDHIWWISDVRRFRSNYPDWTYTYGLDDILGEIIESVRA